MRAMRVSNPRIRELQSEMENDDVLRYVMFGQFAPLFVNDLKNIDTNLCL